MYISLNNLVFLVTKYDKQLINMFCLFNSLNLADFTQREMFSKFYYLIIVQLELAA